MNKEYTTKKTMEILHPILATLLLCSVMTLVMSGHSTPKCICSNNDPRSNHPQILFGKHDFSIKAKITKIFRTRYPTEIAKYRNYLIENNFPFEEEQFKCLRDRYYEVELLEVFKDKGNLKGTCVHRIHSRGTADCPEVCGLTNLERYETYLLSGQIVDGDYYIDKCGLNMLWRETTLHQRNGLRDFYPNNKKCEKWCQFEEGCDKECYYKFASCIKVNNRCGWKKGAGFGDCVELKG